MLDNKREREKKQMDNIVLNDENITHKNIGMEITNRMITGM